MGENNVINYSIKEVKHVQYIEVNWGKTKKEEEKKQVCNNQLYKNVEFMFRKM